MFFDRITRMAFDVASTFLMLLAFGLIALAAYEVVRSLATYYTDIGATLLEAVGYTVIAIAVFDVGKYLLEEEAIRVWEMRRARRGLTKFIRRSPSRLSRGPGRGLRSGQGRPAYDVYPTLLLLVSRSSLALASISA